MKRFIQLIAISAALSAFPAQADVGGGTPGADGEAFAKTHATSEGEGHNCDRCTGCAHHGTVKPDDVSFELREREGWGGAG